MKMAWMGFGAMAWVLWTTRNKALIEGQFIRHPAELLYKLVFFLQSWKLLTKSQDKGHVKVLFTRVHARCTELRRAS